MGDPWVFRGQTPYEVTTQPTCWIYSDRRDVVAKLYTTAHDRYPPFPTGLDRLFFPVYETVTVDWHNTTTGQRGQAVGHGARRHRSARQVLPLTAPAEDTGEGQRRG